MSSWNQERSYGATPETQERRSQVRGLLLIALIVLVFSIWRVGVHHVFTPGWWRLW